MNDESLNERAARMKRMEDASLRSSKHKKGWSIEELNAKSKGTEQMIEDAKREGRKEVVDWIEKNSQSVYAHEQTRTAYHQSFAIDKWLAQLEKWFR